jgi:hypothetical protein
MAEAEDRTRMSEIAYMTMQQYAEYVRGRNRDDEHTRNRRCEGMTDVGTSM